MRVGAVKMRAAETMVVVKRNDDDRLLFGIFGKLMFGEVILSDVKGQNDGDNDILCSSCSGGNGGFHLPQRYFMVASVDGLKQADCYGLVKRQKLRWHRKVLER